MKPSEFAHVSTGLFEGVTPKSGETVNPWEIDDVLILSADSKNGRKYTDRCMQKAISDGLYEGTSFGVNHADSRDVRDLPGHFDKTRFVPGSNGNPSAIRGRMVLTTHDAFTESLHRVAATNPRKYGLSHHIPKGGYKASVANNGTLIVEEIYRVKSVDLVDDPGSGKGLFEETEPVDKIKFRDDAKQYAVLPAEQKRMGAILESMGALADVEITPADAKATPEDKIKSSFKQVMAHITESYDGDDAKLQEQLKVAGKARHAMLTGEEIKEEVTPPVVDDKTKPVLLGTSGAATLLESHKIPITAGLLESLGGQTKEQAVPLLESLKAKDAKITELEQRLKVIPDDQRTRSAPRTNTEPLKEGLNPDGTKKEFKPRYLSASVN